METFSKTRFLNNRPPRVWLVRKNILARITPVRKKFSLAFSWQKSMCGFQVLQSSRAQKGKTCSRHAGVLAMEYRKRISVARSSHFHYLFNRSSYRRPTTEERLENDKDQEKVQKHVFRMRIKKRIYLNFTRDGQKKKQLAILQFPRLSVQKAIDYVQNDEICDWTKYDPVIATSVFRHAKIKGIPLDKSYNDGCGKDWKNKRRVFLKSWDLRYCERDPMTNKMTEEETRDVENWIIENYMAEGPIIGLVMCNRRFTKDLYSDFGFKKYEKFILVDEKGEESVMGHCVVIVGHGTCTCMAKVRGRLKKWKRRFFLVQDSNRKKIGPFGNGLVIVFTNAFDQLWAPSLYGVPLSEVVKKYRKSAEKR